MKRGCDTMVSQTEFKLYSVLVLNLIALVEENDGQLPSLREMDMVLNHIDKLKNEVNNSGLNYNQMVCIVIKKFDNPMIESLTQDVIEYLEETMSNNS